MDLRHELRERVWSAERARQYMVPFGAIRGVNYVPAYCHSYIEMWQHYDKACIRREIGYARDIGINSMRIFVATCQWETQAALLYENLDRFLDLCRENGISLMLTLQPNHFMRPDAAPVKDDPFIIHFSPSRHDKGWTYQGSTGDMAFWPEKKEVIGSFVSDIVTRFADDDRVAFWDLFNEPWPAHLPPLEHVFACARDINPRQPLTSCWQSHDISDITTFHCYEQPGKSAVVQDSGVSFRSFDEELRLALQTGRPALCTECLARTFGNELNAFLPYYRANNIGFYVWGLCAGSAQYHYPWDWPIGSPEPRRWFHCLLYPDGTPYDDSEILLLKQ